MTSEVIRETRDLADAMPQQNDTNIKAEATKGVVRASDCDQSCGDCSSCACGGGSCGSCSSCASCGCDCAENRLGK